MPLRRDSAKPRTRANRWWRRTLEALAVGLGVFLTLSLLLVVVFRWVAPPFSAVMLARYLFDDDAIRYQWTALDRIAPVAVLAVVAAEDQKFPDHYGFDLVSIQEAIERHIEGGRLRGASTISQQVAKNLFLWEGRSWLRKGLEAWFTLLIEGVWSKPRILEVYLNVAELGPGVFGVEAASRTFFHRPASALNESQAALLAAVLPSPIRFRVDAPSEYVRERQRWILKQMRQLGGVAYLEGIIP